MKRLLLVLLAILVWVTLLHAENLSVSSLFSLDGVFRLDQDDTVQDVDLLWQPELFGAIGNEDGLLLRGDLSLRSRLRACRDEMITGPELYRLWGGLSYSSADLRAGLLKLNFGTARILRPEQWFDTIDPLDTREESEGVRGMILTGYTPRGHGLWLWALRHKEPILGSEVSANALGGRLEIPLPGLETGISLNLREKTDAEAYGQTKLGADLRWDGFAGIWLEMAGIRSDSPDPDAEYTSSLTLGTDYTVDIGSGLYLMQETNFLRRGDDPANGLNPNGTTTALLIGYSLGLLDNLQLLSTFDYQGQGSLTLLWQRAYDYLSWEIGLSRSFGSGADKSPTLEIKLNYDI